MNYELDLKPTFMSQLLALPAKELALVMEKVRLLQVAPAPDGKNKKRLVGYKGAVYRIRSGDYRVLYTFGDGWVALLGVDDRKDVYKGEQLVAEAPGFNVADVPDPEDLLVLEEKVTTQWSNAKRTTSAEDELPVKLDAELLGKLRIPDQYVPELVGCKTIDDLLAANVPESILTRVFDVVASPDYDRVIQQPTFVAADTDDLLKFAQGELIEFLLKLDPHQEALVKRAIRGQGPMLVKGGPGTGKSTVALYRVRELIDALREEGNTEPRILFTTYTNALIASSRQLLSRLLGDDAGLVDVRTADALSRELFREIIGSPKFPQPSVEQAALKEAISRTTFPGNALQRQQQVRTLERLGTNYLLEEINTVIDGRALTYLGAYLSAPRNGRRVPLNATQREAVWRVRETFHQVLAWRGVWTWQRFRYEASNVARISSPRYDAVVIDEAQDLDIVSLRMLVNLASSPNRVFVTADANQSIYGGGFRWTDVHDELNFRGRTSILRRNYRSTAQIDRATRSYLDQSALDPPEAALEIAYAQQDGAMPIVRAVGSAYDQTHLLHRFFRQATRAHRMGIGACAVLVPTEEAGKSVAAWLTGEGLDAEFMPGRELDLEKPIVKVLTLKSAKGLEFPIVALAGFEARTFPGLPNTTVEEELSEAMERERRTMYVGMTRAMLALLVAIPASPRHPAAALYAGFDAGSWNTGDTTEGAA